MSNKLENLIDKYGVKVSFYSIIFGIVLTVLFSLISPFNDWSFYADPQLFSNFGDFIGGLVGPLFTLAGFFLIYKTFRTQQKTLEQQNIARLDQQKIFEQERFETTFFNLINNQNRITNDLKVYFHSLKGLTTEITNVVVGREFFIYSRRELNDIWNSLNRSEFAGYFDIENAQYKQMEIDELYNPSSSAFTHPDDAIEQEKNIKYEIRLSHVNKFYSINGETWDNFKKLDMLNKINLVYGLYFQKFHYAAGHYFRHLYHILDFIEKSEKKLTEISTTSEEKNSIYTDYQKYASFVQSQMTSFELLLLYYNSFAFPKMLRLTKKYNILENLAIEDLVDQTHDFDKEITLKTRKRLL